MKKLFTLLFALCSIIAAKAQDVEQIQPLSTGTLAALSPSGALIAIRQLEYSKVNLIDNHGNVVTELIGHGNYINSIVFSQNGKYIVTTSADTTAIVWDLNGNIIQRFRGHEANVYYAAFSDDGTRVITSSLDNTIRIWDLTGNQLSVIEDNDGSVYCAIFDRFKNDVFYCTSSSGNIYKRKTSGEVLITFQGHTSDVYRLALSQNGDKLASAGEDKLGRVWSTDGDELVVLRGHTSWLRSISFSPNEKYIVTTSLDSTARIWDVNDGSELFRTKKFQDRGETCEYMKNGNQLLTASEDNKVLLHDLPETLNSLLALKANNKVKPSTKVINGAAKGSEGSKPKIIIPPNLKLSNVSVSNIGINNILDGLEKPIVSVTITNEGRGMAISLRPLLTSSVIGMAAKASEIQRLEPGASAQIKWQFTAPEILPSGKATLYLEVKEGNKFHSEQVTLSVTTASFVPPLLVLTDYKLENSNNYVTLGTESQIIGQVENRSTTQAKSVRITIGLPDNVAATSDPEINLGDIKANGVARFEFHFSPNREYVGKDIKLKAHLSEATGKYGKTTTMTVGVNAAVTTGGSIEVAPVAQQKSKQVEHAGLTSDVDKDIPVRKGPAVATRYALIIGNEDYNGNQSSANAPESNVAFAVADAQSFRNYVISYFGVPTDHVVFLKDATLAAMKRQVSKMSELMKLDGGKAEVLFFYSGHGLPHPETKKPVLLAIDKTADEAAECLELEWIAKELTTNPHQRVLMFVDACFSGVGKGQANLLAKKGTRMKPSQSGLNGNCVLISSSSEDEPSEIYDEQQHGFFTYHLLKTIKSKPSQLTTKELFEQLQTEVKRSVLIKKESSQTPAIQASPALGSAWEGWVW